MIKLKRTPLFLLLTMTMFISLFTHAAPDPNFHIYLALGQSNMQGAAHLPDELLTHPRVTVLQGQNCQEHSIPYGQWREHFHPVIRCEEGTRTKPDGSTGSIGLSPADSFAIAMAEAAGPDITIGLVGAAYGGTDIQAHLANCAEYGACRPPYGDINGAPVVNGTTPIYQWILDLATKAQEVGVIKGIIFHHGENNAGEQAWLNGVNEYISTLRQDLHLSAAEVPFIAGELPRTGCCANAHNPLVQQIPNYVENGHWVSSGPMPDGTVLGDRSDALHWSTFSVIEMGKRYAAKMLEVSGDIPIDCGIYSDGMPLCCDPNADPDGDGYGEQNNSEVCRVPDDSEGTNVLTVELESLNAQIDFSPFAVAYDDSASDGMFIVWPNSGNQILSAPSDAEAGKVAIDFNLTQNTNVEVRIQANLANGNDDSFYYKLDSGTWNTQNNTPTSGWELLAPTTLNNVYAGSHQLVIQRREDGSRLDFIRLTVSNGQIQSAENTSSSHLSSSRSPSSSSNSASSISSSSSSSSSSSTSITSFSSRSSTSSEGPEAIVADVDVNIDWGQGYCASVSVSNNSGEAINWEIDIPVEGTVGSAWNTTWSQSGNMLTLSGSAWSAILQPGATVTSIGFCASR